MPKLNKTKCNKSWILQNHAKFNEIKKVIWENAKIKEMPKIAPEFWET